MRQAARNPSQVSYLVLRVLGELRDVVAGTVVPDSLAGMPRHRRSEERPDRVAHAVPARRRAGDDEKLLAFGPIIVDLMTSAAELVETTDYGH